MATVIRKERAAIPPRLESAGYPCRDLMIARLWKGWTTLENADAYERLLREQVLPGLKSISGYRGGYILRQDGSDESEFAVLNFFESLDAIRAFAGPDYTIAVFEPEARQLLSKIEPRAIHYEVKMAPE